MIGTLSARRALLYILEAIYILKQKGITIRLKCVGARDAAVDEILAHSHAWPFIKDQVIFKGYMPFPEGVYELEDCFAGLALPETLPNHIRSYPTKMFEYMAIGLPVIASDFSFYKEVVDKYHMGLCATPESPDSISAAIQYLFSDKTQAKLMGENGRKAVTYFDWETESVKLLQFYNKILS
jgi:glycosyltransferase involved in cell wall biosynthesis